MRQGWQLYRTLAAGAIRARMQYRLDFVVTNLIYGFLVAVDFIAVGALLHRFGAISGWNVYEIALLFGISGVAMGLVRTFASELNTFESYIVQGDFDSLLVRPWPTLLMLLSRNVDLGRLGMSLQGALITVLGLRGLAAAGAVPWWSLAYLPLLCLAGAVLFLALMLATAALAFWVQRIDEFQVFTIHAPQNAGYYPLQIYPRWIRLLLTTLLPVAYVNYIPVRYLVGRGGSPLDLALPPLVAAAALAAAYWLWRIGEQRYQSTGS